MSNKNFIEKIERRGRFLVQELATNSSNSHMIESRHRRYSLLDRNVMHVCVNEDTEKLFQCFVHDTSRSWVNWDNIWNKKIENKLKEKDNIEILYNYEIVDMSPNNNSNVDFDVNFDERSDKNVKDDWDIGIQSLRRTDDDLVFYISNPDDNDIENDERVNCEMNIGENEYQSLGRGGAFCLSIRRKEDKLERQSAQSMTFEAIGNKQSILTRRRSNETLLESFPMEGYKKLLFQKYIKTTYQQSEEISKRRSNSFSHNGKTYANLLNMNINCKISKNNNKNITIINNTLKTSGFNFSLFSSVKYNNNHTSKCICNCHCNVINMSHKDKKMT
jgi:hypothetical protein